MGEQGVCGLSVCRYDESDGSLTLLEGFAPELNIGSIFIDRGVLYCTDERRDLPGRRIGGGGLVVAFAIAPDSGYLREISRTPSYGTMPADVISCGSYVLAVNHTTKNGHITCAERDERGGFQIRVRFDESSLVLFPRGPDGSIGTPLDIWAASGEGPLDAQLGPHLHCVRAAPSGELFISCDKGADRIHLFTAEGGRLVLKSSYATKPGYAPRYAAFHPTRPFVFVNNEFQPYLHSFRYHPERGLEEADCLRILPDGADDPKKHGQSDILISRDGKYMYDLHRQLNQIFVLQVDGETGKIELIQTMSSSGKLLRSCAFAPDGRFLLVIANESGQVLRYPIRSDGTLEAGVVILTRPGAAHLGFHKF